MNKKELIEQMNRLKGYLPDFLDIKIVSAKKGHVVASMKTKKKHLAPNGYMHAGAVVSLADTTCGFGTFVNLPEEANNFTTIELKSNFLGTALKGTIYCEAFAEHFGKHTQVWSATVRDETGKKMALFRATQMILYPKA